MTTQDIKQAKTAMRAAAWWLDHWAASDAATKAQRKVMAALARRLRALAPKEAARAAKADAELKRVFGTPTP